MEKKKIVKYPFLIGLVAFVLSLLVTFLIDSSSPLLASLVIAFLIFELSFYYYHHKDKRRSDL
ncbi:hypothetical protein VBD025_14770 [Virgibacillus flavescens]|uniref:hypothetical protein n=1 Tax=Virgibacillus flavescens TaxID=1611422 RepID=UPI003D35565E